LTRSRWPYVALMVVLGGTASAEKAPERHRYVRVPAAAAERLDALSLRPARAYDYRSFRWLELTEKDYAALAGSGLAFQADADAGYLHVAGFRFDPLADGEPWLPDDLRSSGAAASLRLVQLVAPATDVWRAELERTGARVLQYYPHHAYLVWAPAPAAAAAAALPFVRWQGPLHPAYKIGTELLGRQGLLRNVDVTVYDDGRLDATLAALRAAGGEILQHHPAQPDRAFHDVILRLPAEAVEAVSRIPTVWALGASSPRPGLDDEMSSQIQAGNYAGTPPAPFTGYEAWLSSIGHNGSGVRWAVVDTGVDYQHPDLASHIVGGSSFTGACNVPGEPGGDCANGGHGTHVAGIVGGNAAGVFADGQGYKYGLGVAPGYGIFAMNSLSGTAWPPAGGWQEHSRRAVLGGAIGGNNSWNTGEPPRQGYRAPERTHDLMVRDGNFDTATVAEPFTLVFSAGNAGNSGLTPPHEAKNLITVANSLNSRQGDMDAISSTSSRGPAVDGRQHPIVAAPGASIASSRNDLGGQCASPIAGTNGLYAFCSGTSMAAPHVSGAAVLVADWWRGFNDGKDPSPALVKALLVNTAVDMTSNAAGTIWNVEEGWGRVNLRNLFGASLRRLMRDQADTLGAAGETRVFRTRVVDPARPLKVTLAWSDAPGAVIANPALVNDLDLTVTLGAGTYRGNVFSGGWSASGGSADRLNNLENVYVQNASGMATITVAAANVPGDGVPYNADLTDQDFAFVCSNCSTLSPLRIEVDDFDPGGNGVLEDGEDALLLLTWRNDDAQAVGPLTAAVASSSPIQLPQPTATYGTIPAGGDGFAAYGVLASGPRPAAHWDAVVNESLSSGDGHAWTVHIGPTFADVATGSAEYRSVETIAHHRITGGCTGAQYCPAASITRAQMAVFVLLAKEGPTYSPPACVTPLFSDVPAADPFCRWIEELARRGVVSGCGGGAFCPGATVTREQMSVFLLRTLDPALDPPACTTPVFGDVPASNPFCRWIEELARRGVTSGCGGGNFCPAAPNTRGQMAVFVTTGFGLKLYAP
jgi:hypothetical protein